MYNSNLPEHYIERPAIIEEIRNTARGLNPAVNQPINRPPKPTAWEIRHPKKEFGSREPEFIIKRARKWLNDSIKKPDARMLFDRFWYEGELCILFADTNTGKSVLAVQIADSISKGVPVNGLQLEAPACGVLYFDYELTDKQFHQRYSCPGTGNYRFHKTFSRAVTNPQANKMYRFRTYQEYIENEIENSLLIAKAKVLIIDNINCLKYDTHAAAGAFNLVRSLQNIKKKYNIAVMILAHTPKRNPVKPLTRNDLQGSKMLINFCDSAFAIGESQLVPGLRYLKQIKQRSTHQAYGAEKVVLCQLEKPGNFLRFKFTGHGYEPEHLQPYNEQYRKITEARISELSSKGFSIRRIATELNISASTINRITKRLAAGVVESLEFEVLSSESERNNL